MRSNCKAHGIWQGHLATSMAYKDVIPERPKVSLLTCQLKTPCSNGKSSSNKKLSNRSLKLACNFLCCVRIRHWRLFQVISSFSHNAPIILKLWSSVWIDRKTESTSSASHFAPSHPFIIQIFCRTQIGGKGERKDLHVGPIRLPMCLGMWEEMFHHSPSVSFQYCQCCGSGGPDPAAFLVYPTCSVLGKMLEVVGSWQYSL